MAMDRTSGQMQRRLEQQTVPQLLLLSPPDFKEAIKQALRDYHQPVALAKNLLLRSNLLKQLDQGNHATGLKQILVDMLLQLKDNSKDEKFYQVLNATFFENAMTQELAAERLGLPFGTYRYQLNTGIERLVAQLWERELDHS